MPNLAMLVNPVGASAVINRLPARRGGSWLSEGFVLFRRAPYLWIAVTLILFVAAVGLHYVPGGNLVVFTIITPPLMGGMMLACSELTAGRPLRLAHFLAGFVGSRGRRLVALGLLTLAAYGVLWVSVVALMAATLGTQAALSGDLSAANWMHFTLYWTVGLSLWGVVVMATWFAPLLIFFEDARILDAVRASWIGIGANQAAATRYGLWLTLWSVIASLPFFLGWLIAGPAMVASIYVSYRDIYGVRA